MMIIHTSRSITSQNDNDEKRNKKVEKVLSASHIQQQRYLRDVMQLNVRYLFGSNIECVCRTVKIVKRITNVENLDVFIVFSTWVNESRS